MAGWMYEPEWSPEKKNWTNVTFARPSPLFPLLSMPIPYSYTHTNTYTPFPSYRVRSSTAYPHHSKKSIVLKKEEKQLLLLIVVCQCEWQKIRFGYRLVPLLLLRRSCQFAKPTQPDKKNEWRQVQTKLCTIFGHFYHSRKVKKKLALHKRSGEGGSKKRCRERTTSETKYFEQELTETW